MDKESRSGVACILLVDEDINARTIFPSVLQEEGYRVTAVKNGYEAIKAIDKESFDLALVNLGLPILDGIEILEYIKKRKPHVPVIIYTGHGSIATVVEAMRKGAADYLVKPFSPTELKRSVKEALEGGRNQSSIEKDLKMFGRKREE